MEHLISKKISVTNLILEILSVFLMSVGVIMPFYFLVGFGFIAFFLGAMGADMNDPIFKWAGTIIIPVLLIGVGCIAVLVLGGLAFFASLKNQVRKYVKYQIADCVCIVVVIISEIVIAVWNSVFGQDPDTRYIMVAYILLPSIQGVILAVIITLTALQVKKAKKAGSVR